MNGRPSNFTHSFIPEALSGRSSRIGVAPRAVIASALTMAYMRKSTLHDSPNVGISVVAPHVAIIGARKEAIAFDELTECQGRRKLVAAYKVGHQRIERCSHYGVADSKQRE